MYKYPWMGKKLDEITLDDLYGSPGGYSEAFTILCLRTKPYHEYLTTAHWASVRAQKIKERPLCELCRKRTAREIHHISYENKGCEPMEDLQSLCSECHKKLHDHWIYKDPPGETFSVSISW